MLKKPPQGGFFRSEIFHVKGYACDSDIEWLRGGAAVEADNPQPPASNLRRIASDMVMNDGSLHKGAIVSTDRGFFLYRGLGDFVRVPNPLSSRQP
jgi:hypothetical protein